MIKAIILDLGGVIQGLDWSPVINSLLDLKGDLTIDTYKSSFYHDRKNYFDLYATAKMNKEDFWGMVASKLGLNKKDIERLCQSFELLYSFTNYDLLKLLEKLKSRYKLFALSNACPEIENKIVKDRIYNNLFDKFYFSHNMGLKKPDKEAYLMITEENNLKPEECLFIDNDLENIKGAENVGMKAVLYESVELLKKKMRDNNLIEDKPVIGYTTGVFDLFHIGHLNLLKNAKKHCDKLIVGITTDDLSLRFKGKKPVIPFEERMKIVSAIKYVDQVVPQTDMDKFESWKKYKWDVVFASTNPTKKWPEVEAEFKRKFKEEGIKPPKVIRLPYTPEVSSTIRKCMLKK